jgi:hypothetical protein
MFSVTILLTVTYQYVARGDLPEDWGGDVREISGEFGE